MGWWITPEDTLQSLASLNNSNRVRHVPSMTGLRAGLHPRRLWARGLALARPTNGRAIFAPGGLRAHGLVVLARAGLEACPFQTDSRCTVRRPDLLVGFPAAELHCDKAPQALDGAGALNGDRLVGSLSGDANGRSRLPI